MRAMRYEDRFCSGKRKHLLNAAEEARARQSPEPVLEQKAKKICALCDGRYRVMCRHPDRHTMTRSGRPARTMALLAKAAAKLDKVMEKHEPGDSSSGPSPYDWAFGRRSKSRGAGAIVRERRVFHKSFRSK